MGLMFPLAELHLSFIVYVDFYVSVVPRDEKYCLGFLVFVIYNDLRNPIFKLTINILPLKTCFLTSHLLTWCELVFFTFYIIHMLALHLNDGVK